MKNLRLSGLVLAIVALVLPLRSASALVPVFDWSVTVKSSSTNESPTRDVAVDSAGNTYVVGGFYGTVDFDPSAATVNLAPDETLGAFIAKYSPSGALEWAFDVGYGNSSQFNSVKVDSNGDIWVGGGIAGKMNPLITQVNVNPRGASPTYVTGLSETGSHAVMLKYNSAGILLEAWKPMSATAGSQSRIFDFDFGASTGLIVAGSFSGTHDFDTDPAAAANSTSTGTTDAFLGAYSATGGYFDHVIKGGADYDDFRSIDYRNGNVVAAGAIDNAGSVTSYAWGTGSFVQSWSFPIGSNNSYDRTNSVAIDASDNVLVAGTIAGTKNFKGMSATNVNLAASNTYTNAAYLAQYSQTGMHVLSHLYSSATGSSSAYADEARMVIGDDGSVYVASRIMGTVDFDVSSGVSNYSTPSNGQRSFLAKYNSSLVLDGVSNLDTHATSNSTGQNVVGIAPTSNHQGLRLALTFGFSSTTTAKAIVQAFGPDTSVPQVTSVTATNANGSYRDGVQLTIKVTFNESVVVTGSPEILLALGAGGRIASYSSGTGSTEVLFTYTTQSGDSSADLDYTSTSALSLNGGAINDAWGNAAVLTLPTVGSGASIAGQKAIIVDTTAPSLSSVSPTNGASGIGVSSNIVLSFSENVVRGTGNYTLLSGNSCGTTVETISATASAVSVSGNDVTINPVTTLGNSTNYCLTYPAGAVKDVAGNSAPAMTLSSSPRVDFTTAAGDVTPPTATLTSPGLTSSSRTLSYSLVFSEQISGLVGGDFLLTGTATCSAAPSGTSGISLTVVVTCTSDGTVILRLSANSVTDAAMNTGPTAIESAASVTISTVAPTVAPTTPPTPTSSVSPSISTVVPSPTTSIVQSGLPTEDTSSSTVAPVSPTKSSPSTSAPQSAQIAESNEVVNDVATSTSVAPTTTIPLDEIEIPNVDDQGAGVLVGGRVVSVQVSRNNNEVSVVAGSISARIWVIRANGDKVPLNADGRLRPESGDSVVVSVDGFSAKSDVEVRLYSDPILLGRSQVDDRGTLAASYSIPDGVESGNHRIVLAGESNDESVTFALAITIGETGEGVGIAEWILVPLLVAIVAAMVIPVALRRRRRTN